MEKFTSNLTGCNPLYHYCDNWESDKSNKVIKVPISCNTCTRDFIFIWKVRFDQQSNHVNEPSFIPCPVMSIKNFYETKEMIKGNNIMIRSLYIFLKSMENGGGGPLLKLNKLTLTHKI